MKLSDILAERVGDEKAYYFIIIVNSISSFVTACQHTFSGFDSRRLHQLDNQQYQAVRQPEIYDRAYLGLPFSFYNPQFMGFTQLVPQLFHYDSISLISKKPCFIHITWPAPAFFTTF